MSVTRVKAAAAAALLSVLALAGCAVPGQGDPGVAAEYKGNVITFEDLADIAGALDDLSSPDIPGEAGTLALVGPEAVRVAESFGLVYDEATVRDQALLWQAAQRSPEQIEPTEAQLQVTYWTSAISFCMLQEGPALEFAEAVRDIEANAVTSPRLGDFTWQKFVTSVGPIENEFNQRADELGPAIFMVFANVNGLYSGLLEADWTTIGGDDTDAAA